MKNYTNANLLKNSRQTANYVERDLNAFESFGYSISDVEQLWDAINACENAPSFEYSETLRMRATVARQEAEQVLRTHLRVLLYRVKEKFGDSSPNYCKINVSKMLKPNLNILLKTPYIVYNQLKGESIYTEQAGITNKQINDIKVMGRAFAKAYDNETNLIKMGKRTTKQRNKLFKTMFTKAMRLNRTGKLIFFYTDEVRYQDYVAFGVKSASANTETEVEPIDNVA